MRADRRLINDNDVHLSGMATARQLEALLSAPVAKDGHRHAAFTVASAVPKPIVPSKLAATLSPLLESEQAAAETLATQLEESTAGVDALLKATKQQLVAVLGRAHSLRSSHEVLEDSLIDHREALVSSLSQREAGGGSTLRERLEALSQRRKELEVVKDWFTVLAKAEELG